MIVSIIADVASINLQFNIKLLSYIVRTHHTIIINIYVSNSTGQCLQQALELRLRMIEPYIDTWPQVSD